MTNTITIPDNYNGPAHSGHGGTAAGHFAGAVNPKAASVRFHKPVPLGQPLRPVGGSNKSVIFDSEGPVATVRPLASPLRIRQVGRLAEQDVTRAEDRWLDARSGQHMAPTCYACGHERKDDHGLGLRPGPVEDSALFACRWMPQVSGEVPDWLLWAALDCPSGMPALHGVVPDQAVVTGELSVELLAAVTGGHDYQLIGRSVDVDGRRHTTEAALVDERGVAVARANAIWITVPLAMIGSVTTKASQAA